MKTVERIIGMRSGTGGSTGVTYLRKALETLLLSRTLVRARQAVTIKAYTPCLIFVSHFSRFLGTEPDRLHFAAHSHHPWPDVTRDAQVQAWDDAARLDRQQVGACLRPCP